MSRALTALAAAAMIAAPAAALGYGFNAEYAGTPIPTIGSLEISVNPEIVRDARGTALTRGSEPEYIDPADAEELIEELREDLEGDLSRSGVYAPMTAGPVGVLRVTIESARSSNPAHTRTGQARQLDFRSAGRGGATIVAELVGPDGASVAEFSYRWEESTFDVASTPRIAWYGAERAFDRFSSRLARELD